MAIRRLFDGAAVELGYLSIDPVGSSSTIQPTLISSSIAFFAPQILGGTQEIALSLLSASTIVLNPTIAADEPTIQVVNLNRIRLTTSFLLLDLLQSTSLSRIESSASFFSSTIATSNAIDLSAISSSSSLFSPTVSAAATVSLDRVESDAAVFQPTASAATTIGLSVIASTAAFFAPTVSAASGVQSIALVSISSASTFPAAVLTAESIIGASPIASAAAVRQPTVSAGAVSISLDRFGGASVPTPEIVRVVALQEIVSSESVFAPALGQMWPIVFSGWDVSTAIFPLTLEREGQGTVPRFGHKKTASGGGGLAFRGSGSLRLKRASGPQRPIRP